MDQRVASSTQMGKGMFWKYQTQSLFSFSRLQRFSFVFKVQRKFDGFDLFFDFGFSIYYSLFLLCFLICLKFNRKIDEFGSFF